MANLRVFISSTYYDLKHVRSYVASFITKMGYDATLSEKGKIAYDPSLPLDESCYQDTISSNILVLIVGGRYGSATSETDTKNNNNEFYQRYESVTRKEFETASSHNIPTYILVEKAVMVEYETFKKNRGNDTVTYAHVDSVNIFNFLDDILSKGRNNPVFQFEQPQEIESWLKNQWSGYFRTLLEKKHQNQQITSLSNQVSELKSINSSLQRYLEKIVQSVAGDSADEIIEQEHNTLTNEKIKFKLMGEGLFSSLVNRYNISYNDVKSAYESHNTISETIAHIVRLSDRLDAQTIKGFWQNNDEILNELNTIRDILEKPHFILDWDSI
ncbi:DUF4062 domain-containing protein [Aeromonas veronii]|uniref:DUF4062 domain-containing protein n=1 Tax=Aeromonas veronii TaxID=654 RepID=UPI0009571C45|nr:DUF4062 domain-containing protein [Aeromonas veronii]SIQ47996.1 protein of unknown function [Aeromonas veronii]